MNFVLSISRYFEYNWWKGGTFLVWFGHNLKIYYCHCSLSLKYQDSLHISIYFTNLSWAKHFIMSGYLVQDQIIFHSKTIAVFLLLKWLHSSFSSKYCFVLDGATPNSLGTHNLTANTISKHHYIISQTLGRTTSAIKLLVYSKNTIFRLQ